MVIPGWGTYLVLKTLFLTVEGFLGELLQRELEYYIPGLGILSLILLIFFAGVLVTNFLGKKVLGLWESLLKGVPVVRTVYSLIKSIVDTLSMQGKQKFNRVVLISFPQKDQFVLAFVTGTLKGETQRVMKRNMVSVFVPTTPNPTSGYTLLVPEEEVIPLSMTVEEGMKMIVSGGFYSPKAHGDSQSVMKGTPG